MVKSFKMWKTIIILLIISLATENIRIFSMFGGDIKLPHIACILAILVVFREKIIIRRNSFIVVNLFIILPMLPLYRISNQVEWIKSYMNYSLIIIFLFFVIPQLIKMFNVNYKNYFKLIIYIIAFTQILAVIQFIMMNFLGIFFLQDIFGVFQFHSSMFGIQNGYYRAYSIYHEPSVLGWVCTSSISFILFSKINIFPIGKKFFFLLLSFITILLTFSSSALCILIAIILTYLLVNKVISIKFMFVLGGIILSLVICILFTDVLDSLKRIPNEIFTENTSGYERINTPIQYSLQTLRYYPIFGRGIGQEGLVDKVGIIGNYMSINNAILGIFVNFGLSSVCIYYTIFRFLHANIIKNKNWWILSINMFGVYLSTGAYLSLDIFVFLVITILIGNMNVIKEEEINT